MLSDYLKLLEMSARVALAKAAGTTYLHLRNIAFSGKSCGALLAVDIEAATDGAVRRQDLRPDDWHRIWPELIGTDGARQASPPMPHPQEPAAPLKLMTSSEAALKVRDAHLNAGGGVPALPQPAAQEAA